MRRDERIKARIIVDEGPRILSRCSFALVLLKAAAPVPRHSQRGGCAWCCGICGVLAPPLVPFQKRTIGGCPGGVCTSALLEFYEPELCISLSSSSSFTIEFSSHFMKPPPPRDAEHSP